MLQVRGQVHKGATTPSYSGTGIPQVVRMAKALVRAMYLRRNLGLCHLILLAPEHRHLVAAVGRDGDHEVEDNLHINPEGRPDE